MIKRHLHSGIWFLCLVLFYTTVFGLAPTQPFLVIVNKTNKITEIDRKFLSDIFYKKTTVWEDNQKIQPVDLESKSTVRNDFSLTVHKHSVNDIKIFWQQHIFSGFDIPPDELNNDAEVINYVHRHSGAIGYVSPSADTSSVKTITIK